MAQKLSEASPYEQTFGTRQRQVGRPSGDTEPLFASALGGKAIHPIVMTVARRRAYAVVQAEQRERMREVFLAEVKVLNRRSLEVVAGDAGMTFEEPVDPEPGQAEGHGE